MFAFVLSIIGTFLGCIAVKNGRMMLIVIAIVGLIFLFSSISLQKKIDIYIKESEPVTGKVYPKKSIHYTKNYNSEKKLVNLLDNSSEEEIKGDNLYPIKENEKIDKPVDDFDSVPAPAYGY